MKVPTFLTPPVYPPQRTLKDSISTQTDDYLKPVPSNEKFTFKSQLTSLYMYPTDYTFKLHEKNQDFFTSIASKIMTLDHFWLDLLFSLLLKKQHTIIHILPFSNTKCQKITVS